MVGDRLAPPSLDLIQDERDVFVDVDAGIEV
jgi:hypothetical protein